ncbi:hypothetical protein TNCT_729051 [Trichonephila clavata]|uniref:Uncharacterized protein n=1 Tax=Trichonephila clavata TaxID=2740835 RepID=A0A8X6KL48_TRICU|nr:hypothetical protein TNCT_729051 [Trichonephila clavata]
MTYTNPKLSVVTDNISDHANRDVIFYSESRHRIIVTNFSIRENVSVFGKIPVIDGILKKQIIILLPRFEIPIQASLRELCRREKLTPYLKISERNHY